MGQHVCAQYCEYFVQVPNAASGSTLGFLQLLVLLSFLLQHHDFHASNSNLCVLPHLWTFFTYLLDFCWVSMGTLNLSWFKRISDLRTVISKHAYLKKISLLVMTSFIFSWIWTLSSSPKCTTGRAFLLASSPPGSPASSWLPDSFLHVDVSTLLLSLKICFVSN